MRRLILAVALVFLLAAAFRPMTAREARASGSGGEDYGLLGPFKHFQVGGGYVAAGIGMTNLGYGSITIRGIPLGSDIEGAYLYWTVLGGDSSANRGVFDGRPITGRLIGSGPGPCWPNPDAWPAASYRADVTRFVNGNGSYRLSGFDSDLRNGADPWLNNGYNVRQPRTEGASLVVVYSDPGGDPVQVMIYGGYALADGNRSGGNILTTRISGFYVPRPIGDIKTTFVVADGQSNLSEPGATVN